MITKIAEILGVSEESIKTMPKDIFGSMQAVLANIEVKNEDDAKMLCDELDRLWVKGTVLLGLKEAAENTGIPYNTLCNLGCDTQQELVFEYMADSENTAHFYEIVSPALAVAELGKVAKLLDISIDEIKKLPLDMQEKMCGMYSMEYEENGDNTSLIAALKGMVNS